MTHPLDAPGTWARLDGSGDVSVSRRLIGGCIETLSNLTGTASGDLAGFARDHAPEGLLFCIEADQESSYDIGRRLHGMKLAGWFADANAILVGCTSASDQPDPSQHAAVLDALGELNWSTDAKSLTQTLT